MATKVVTRRSGIGRAGHQHVGWPTDEQQRRDRGRVSLFEARLRADGRLFLSADLYEEHGVRLGAFASHVWQTPQRDAELLCARKHVDVRHGVTGAVLLSVSRCDNQLVVTAIDLW